ncbi:MAG: FtsQ-type POTRA domain-containing protein, partial [Nitrospirae bacterium]|nr:FtsQ-type POTRA domain-containing protein [Nitrospirota bacterium]
MRFKGFRKRGSSGKKFKRGQPNRRKKKSFYLPLLNVFGVLLAAGGLVWMSTLAEFWLEESPLFTVRNIKIEGLSYLKEEHLARELEEIKNRSMFNVSLNEVRERLESDPWIKSATLKKHFPDGITVRIVEKQPAFYLMRGQSFCLADEEGRFIAEAAAPFKNIPELKGVHVEKWLRGDEKEASLVRKGVAFYRMAMQPNFLVAKEDLSSIELRSENDLVATIGGIPFLFRYPYSSQQWFRFLSVKNDILSRNIDIEDIDLRFSGKVIVKP